MTIALRLNRRHKAALFATLVAAGASLVSGDATKMGLGTILLGAAFAWAFGSDSRVVHYLFLGCGLLIVIGPVTYDWHAHREQAQLYQDRVAEFERRIPDFAKSYPVLPCAAVPLDKKQQKGSPSCGTRTGQEQKKTEYTKVIMPDGTVRYWPSSLGEAEIRRLALLQSATHNAAHKEELGSQVVSKWYADAVAAGVKVMAVPDEEKPGEPPEPFKLWQSVGNERLFIVPGVFLFFIGVGLLFGVKPARNESKPTSGG